MTSNTVASILAIAQLFGWLFLVLPVFEYAHFRSFLFRHRNSNLRVGFLDWYRNFAISLRQRAAREPQRSVAGIRRGLLYLALVMILFGIYILLSFAQGSQKFSPLVLIAVLLCIDVVFLFLGFIVSKNFSGLSSLEKSVMRQSALLVLAVGFVTVPTEVLPWGIRLSPIAFLCACFAITIFVRQWQEDEYPLEANIRKTLQSEFMGVELIVFRLIRSLECLLLYALVVVVFLSGPLWNDVAMSNLQTLMQFTLKLGALAVAVLVIYTLTPKISRNSLLRTIFLFLLPMELVGYPLSLYLKNFFE